MKVQKIHPKRGVNVKLKSVKSKYTIDTSHTDPKLPSMFVFCGSRSSSKTYSCVAMCSHFEKKKYIIRTFLICPTKASIEIFYNLKTLNEKKDVCDDSVRGHRALNNIMAEVKRDWAKYEADVLYQHVHNNYWKGQKIMPLKYTYVLESRNHALPTKPHKPSHMLIIDDCQGTNLYGIERTDLMSHISIKHRHLPLTICFLVQSWTGLPRVIRLNATHFIVYMMGDKKQLKQIYENFANTIEEEDFMVMYKYATSKPHGFLYIDTDPKEKNMRFRSGFNEFIGGK